MGVDKKNNLFKVRNLDRWDKWNSEQPEIDGIKINQYDNEGRKQGIWQYIINDDGDVYESTNMDGIPYGMWYRKTKDGQIYRQGDFGYTNRIKKLIFDKLNSEQLDEVEIKKKELIGKGSYHNVYPTKDNAKVIKVNRYRKLNDNEEWVEIFNKYPEFFPKIYRVKNNYAVVEKLDTKQVKDEINLMLNDLEKNLPTLYFEITDMWDITEFLSRTIMGKLMGYRGDVMKLEQIINMVDNKDIFNRWVNTIEKIMKLRVKDYLDAHEENFGYDNNGNLKMLDI